MDGGSKPSPNGREQKNFKKPYKKLFSKKTSQKHIQEFQKPHHPKLPINNPIPTRRQNLEASLPNIIKYH
jgi:hypothetical protein